MKFTTTDPKLRSALDQKEAQRECLLVHFIASSKGYLPVEPPKMAKEIECPFCGCSSYFLHMVDKERRGWFCEQLCAGSMLPKSSGSMDVPPTPKRALLWPLFCEINGIGDIHHGVRFENIKQSAEKIAIMLKFANNPSNILFLQGTPGSGKTYAAMAICEFFTRKSTACLFGTQRQIFDNWLGAMREDKLAEFIHRAKEIELFVIDDFGIGESTVPFMTFVMDVINTRLQWSKKGTIITTNLEIDGILKLTSPAFLDRLSTGTLLVLKEKSRRKLNV